MQIREKDVDGADFLAAVREAIAVARPYGVPVLVNDRIDVALAAGKTPLLLLFGCLD